MQGICGELSSALRTDVYASVEESYSSRMFGVLRRATVYSTIVLSTEEVNDEHGKERACPAKWCVHGVSAC